MEADGVEIRPLQQITGDREFNEVFFDDAFVPEDHLVGGLNNGWAVANTTLAHERGTTFPFKEQVVHEVYLDDLYRLAARDGLLDDVDASDALAQSFVELRVLRLHNWRTLSRLAKHIEPGPESSWIKLAWSDMIRTCCGVRFADIAVNPRRSQKNRLTSRRSPSAACSTRPSSTSCWATVSGTYCANSFETRARCRVSVKYRIISDAMNANTTASSG